MPGAGQSTQNSNTTQSSTTAPWEAAQPEVSSLINGVQGLIPGASSLNPTEAGAISDLTNMGAGGNPFSGATATAVNGMLNGGGATSEVPFINNNYSNFESSMAPYAAPGYSTLNTPAVQNALQTAKDDVTNQVESQFEAGGRSGSGMDQQTLARGIAQAEAPIILGQANQDTATNQNAIDSIYNGGNTTAGEVANLNQTGVNNENTGINNVNTALTNSEWGPLTELEAQQLGQKIPAQNLGMLANIGIPLAQLGSTSSGTGTSNTTNNMSPIQEFDGIMQGLGGITQSASGATSGTGALGLLAML